MADLTIRITTKYAEATKGFSQVTSSLTKYRNELLKANAENKVTEQMWLDYRQALQNALMVQDLTKDGMAALTGQAKILGREVAELGMAFGENNEGYKGILATLNSVKADMQAFEKPVKQVSQGIQEIGKTSDSTGLKLLSVAKNILKFQLLMGPITSVVRGFRNTLSDSVKLAGEAEQRFSKLATVFDGFGDSAKRMAQSLASSIGVANSTAASALSTVGDLLQAQGMGTGESLSTASEWVRAFQDIIAFKDINMSLEEFAQNFMSGAAGNLRNFRTFGSIVKESAVQAELAKKGLDKLTGSQLELAKMTTRAEMALSQQANAMGATKREWDTMLSVNRRSSEAWKEWKETLGDTINKALKPAKAWWTEILEEINKANKAQQEFAKGSRDIGVYSIHEKEKDWDSFQKAIRGATPLESLKNFVNPTENNASLRAVYQVAVKFGATMEDVLKALKGTADDLTNAPGARQILEGWFNRDAWISAENKARENRGAQVQSSLSEFDSFVETIRAITGAGSANAADWSGVDWSATERLFGVFQEGIQASFSGVIGHALEAIKEQAETNLSSWGDIITGELNELDEGELRQGVANSLKSLFEAAWNQFNKDGVLSEDEVLRLEEIRTAYKEAKTALDDYNKSLEAQKNILSLYNSAQNNIRQRAAITSYTSQGFSDAQARLMFEKDSALGQLYELFGEKTQIEIEGNIIKLDDAVRTLTQDYDEQIKALKESNKAMTSWGKALEQVKESPLFQSIDQFRTDYSTAKTNAMEAGVPEGAATLEGIGMGILGFLATLATQTEVFQEFVDILKPAIETMNNFLKPLEPAILAMSEAISYLVYALLEPLFPVIKIIATVLLTIGTVVSTIAAAVTNVGRGIGNFFRGLFGMEKKQYIDISAIWSEYAERLDAIWNATFEIAQNTKPTNDDTLKAYQEMYQRQMITESEYMALIKGLEGVRYDSMRTAGSYAWNNGRAGTTNVYYGDLKFVIEGTNLSADQIADAVARKIEFRNYTGQYA